MKRQRLLAFAVVVLLVAPPGCGGLSVGVGPVRLGSEGIDVGGSFGSSLGAGGLTHALIEGTGGANAAQWAAAVAVGTFVAGEIVQEEVERRRAQHERESEYLDSEIAIAEKSIQERETELSRIETDLGRQKRTIADLERRGREDAAFARRSEETIAELDTLIERLDEEREIAEAEIEIYTEAVRSSKDESDHTVTEEELEKRRAALLAKRDQRLRQYEMVVARGQEARSLKVRVETLDS